MSNSEPSPLRLYLLSRAPTIDAGLVVCSGVRVDPASTRRCKAHVRSKRRCHDWCSGRTLDRKIIKTKKQDGLRIRGSPIPLDWTALGVRSCFLQSALPSSRTSPAAPALPSAPDVPLPPTEKTPKEALENFRTGCDCAECASLAQHLSGEKGLLPRSRGRLVVPKHSGEALAKCFPGLSGSGLGLNFEVPNSPSTETDTIEVSFFMTVALADQFELARQAVALHPPLSNDSHDLTSALAQSMRACYDFMDPADISVRERSDLSTTASAHGAAVLEIARALRPFPGFDTLRELLEADLVESGAR